MADLPRIVVLLFGVIVCMFSVWAMLVPESLRRLVSAITDQAWGYYLAAAVRVLLGLMLILAAPGSRFPVVFQVVGWLAIVAAAGLLIAGQGRLSKLVEWFNRFSDAAFRVWLLAAVAFGLFLVFGAS